MANNSVVDRLLNRNKVSYFKEDGTPKTVVRSGGGLGSGSGLSSGGRSTEQLNTFWSLYRNDGTIFAAVNLIAFNTVMVGYTIQGDDDDAKNLIKLKFKQIGMDNHLLSMVRLALVLGDSFTEKIYNKKGGISRLKKINPKTMEIIDDLYGDIQGYQQNVGGKKGKKIDPKFVSHFNLFEDLDTPYGISIIEPSLDAIQRMRNTDAALASAVIRHGMPKYVATVGTSSEGVLPPDEVLDDIQTELEDITHKTEFTIPWNVSITTIDEQGIQGIEEYFSYFLTKVVLGLMVPEESLGLGGGSTEATASVKAVLFERMIKAFQNRLAYVIRTDIINEILEENGYDPDTVYIKFNSVTEEDEALKAKWFGNLMNTFSRTALKPFTLNEIRTMFGFDTIDVEWANVLNYELGNEDNGKEPENDEESGTTDEDAEKDSSKQES